MAKKISARQCRLARGLLQWNLHDLNHASGVQVKRLDDFERGLQHLLPYEYYEIIRAFNDEGVEFNSEFEVNRRGRRAPKKQKATTQMHEQETIVIDENSEMFDDLMKESEDREEEEREKEKKKELEKQKEREKREAEKNDNKL